MSNIEHVFFDLDHTLWDFDKNSKLAFEKILKLNVVNVDLDHFLEHYVPINLKYWKLYREEKVNQTNLRYNRLKDTFNAVSVSVSDEKINKLSQDYMTYLTHFNYLLEGTQEILEYLKPRYKLHIITNGFQEAQDKKIEKSKLSHYFETITNSEMAGVKKPNPKIFNMALEFAKTNPEKSIMIGDNFEADVQGALDVGMAAICYNYHNIKLEENIKSISHLLELKHIL